MKYFIDLNDTLVNSTNLNNDAYNFALEQYGFDRIITKERLTRVLLTGYKNLNEIIQLKQKYFTLDWLPYRLILNKELLLKISKFGKLNCFLWTKADKIRAIKIMESCNLSKLFNDVIFDDKINFSTSLHKLKQISNSNNIVIYENNHDFFQNQKYKIIDKINNQYFNIKGYLVWDSLFYFLTIRNA